MARLNKQRAKLDELLGGVNAFNAKSRAEEIGRLLDEYIPGVEKMQTQLKKYSGAFTETVKENRSLKKQNAELSQSLSEAQSESVLKRMKDLQLQRDYNEAIALLDKIPQEVLSAYSHGTHGRKERPIEEVL